MTLEVKKFVQNPLYANAVLVTEENMAELSQWCEGAILSSHEGIPFIKVTVIRSKHERQSQAFVGDWVLRTQFGYKVYTPKAFERSFTEIEESDPKAVELLEAIFTAPFKPALKG